VAVTTREARFAILAGRPSLCSDGSTLAQPQQSQRNPISSSLEPKQVEAAMGRGLAGAHIAVTGGGGGIGHVTCRWLADAGAVPYALDLSAADDQGCDFIRADVTDPASVDAAAEELLARAGRIDGLVAGAGIVENDVAAEDMDLATFESVLAVNLRGVFLTCQAFGRRMLAQGEGRIVTISSMSGNHVVNVPQRQCAYNASKAGVTALTKSLAVEWGPRGVRVNAVSPGYVETPLLARKPAEQHERWKSGIVLRRFAEPREIAAAIGYLLSDDAAYCCGTELLIDGGYSLQ
jgi:NAD(P)-dependent dehydrogenase (short-subunit alcohol dehydrogenase family)